MLYKNISQSEYVNHQNTEKETAYNSIAKKAKEAGLDDIRVQELVNLIKQKDKDLENIKNNKSPNINTGFFEMSTTKAPREITNTFTENVAKLITQTEYALILGNQLKPISRKKTNEEIQKVQSNYNLTKDQYKTLYAHIEQYYFNKIIITYYYGYNRKLVSQKLNALLYYYEKEYKKLMDSFQLTIKSSPKANNNTYQY